MNYYQLASHQESTNRVQELRQLEQVQANLLLNVNLVLKKQIEEYLKQQETILENGESGIREEVITELVAMFMEFAKNIILNQERVNKVKNQEKITEKDLDNQLHQANLYNWWSTKQVDLYFKMKKIYYLQRSKEYEE